MPDGPLNVLVVDDSRLIREIVKDILLSDPGIGKVSEAENGQVAVESVRAHKPDFIIMDIIMPVMDGITATEHIMSEKPTPIMILSSSVSGDEVSNAFAAIKRGALEVMEKPKGIISKDTYTKIRADLLDKVKFLSRIKVITHPRRRFRVDTAGKSLVKSSEKVVAIGASTGGPRAVMSILKDLPQEFPSPILVAQHITPGFSSGFADWLGKETGHRVVMSRDGEVVQKGTVYVASTDRHMAVDGDRIRHLDLPPVNSVIPSVDVLFFSVAKSYNENAISVLLTGMGKDGAKGARQIKDQGGYSIAQDEKSSVIYGMPKVAVEMGGVNEVLPLSKIPEELIRLVTKG
jgi:two-component system chemotaxis response regulator CheB